MDPGALSVALVAAAAAFIIDDGDWNILGVVMGIALLSILLAYHQPWRGPLTLQGFFLRLAFAGTVTIALGIALAFPVQEWIVRNHEFQMRHVRVEFPWNPPYCLLEEGCYDPAGTTTQLLSWAWFVVTPVVVWLEPSITRALRWKPSRNPAPGAPRE